MPSGTRECKSREMTRGLPRFQQVNRGVCHYKHAGVLSFSLTFQHGQIIAERRRRIKPGKALFSCRTAYLVGVWRYPTEEWGRLENQSPDCRDYRGFGRGEASHDTVDRLYRIMQGRVNRLGGGCNVEAPMPVVTRTGYRQ
jgi:hypothetical protein